MSIDRDGLRRMLESLPFEEGRWSVAGSAPMLMAGLVDSITDVDIVTDGTAWRQAVSMSDHEPRPGLFGDRIVELEVGGSRVEVFDGWLGTTADEIISEAVDVEGFRFSPLSRVLASKRRLSRSKDRAHIDLLEALLTDGPLEGSR